MENSIVISESNGELVVSSRQVAENFGKRHANVIRDIERHSEGLKGTNSKLSWFHESSYSDGKAKFAQSIS